MITVMFINVVFEVMSYIEESTQNNIILIVNHILVRVLFFQVIKQQMQITVFKRLLINSEMATYGVTVAWLVSVYNATGQ